MAVKFINMNFTGGRFQTTVSAAEENKKPLAVSAENQDFANQLLSALAKGNAEDQSLIAVHNPDLTHLDDPKEDPFYRALVDGIQAIKAKLADSVLEHLNFVIIADGGVFSKPGQTSARFSLVNSSQKIKGLSNKFGIYDGAESVLKAQFIKQQQNQERKVFGKGERVS